MFDVFSGIKCDKVKTEYFRNILLKAARTGEHIYQNELNRINNLPCVRESEGKVTLRTLFIEYWDFFHAGNEEKIRPSVKNNVEAMIHCKDFSKGYLTYECPNCKNLVNIGLSCNSRFCASCGNRYRELNAKGNGSITTNSLLYSRYIPNIPCNCNYSTLYTTIYGCLDIRFGRLNTVWNVNKSVPSCCQTYILFSIF